MASKGLFKIAHSPWGQVDGGHALSFRKGSKHWKSAIVSNNDQNIIVICAIIETGTISCTEGIFDQTTPEREK